MHSVPRPLAGPWRQPLAVALAALVFTLSGCIDADGAELEATDSALEEIGPAVELIESPEAPGQTVQSLVAPTLALGRYLAVELALEDGTVESWTSIVAQETEDAWVLHASDVHAAAMEVAFDQPLLGAYPKADLASTEWYEPFLFRFPLSDGQQWSFEIPWHPEPIDVTTSVRYDDAIDTAKGPREGFVLHSVTSEGATVFHYDYVPEIGTHSKRVRYSLADPAVIIDELTVTDWGDGWDGPIVEAIAEPLITHSSNLNAGGSVPNPYSSFEVPADAEHLIGFAHSWAANGANEVILHDPEGGHRRFASNTIEGQGFVTGQLWEPAIGGTWQLTAPGVGTAAHTMVFVWSIQAALLELDLGDPSE